MPGSPTLLLTFGPPFRAGQGSPPLRANSRPAPRRARTILVHPRRGEDARQNSSAASMAPPAQPASAVSVPPPCSHPCTGVTTAGCACQATDPTAAPAHASAREAGRAGTTANSGATVTDRAAQSEFGRHAAPPQPAGSRRGCEAADVRAAVTPLSSAACPGAPRLRPGWLERLASCFQPVRGGPPSDTSTQRDTHSFSDGLLPPSLCILHASQ